MIQIATAFVFLSGAALAATGTFATLKWQSRMDQALPGFIDRSERTKTAQQPLPSKLVLQKQVMEATESVAANGSSKKEKRVKLALLNSAIDDGVVVSDNASSAQPDLAQAKTDDAQALPQTDEATASSLGVVDMSGLAVAEPGELTLDVLRVENDRKLSAAGTGKPGSTILLVDGNQILARTIVGDKGGFSLLSVEPISAGNKSIILVSRSPDGSQKRSAVTGIVRLPAENEPGNIMTLIVGSGTPTRITQDTQQRQEAESASDAGPEKRDVAPDVTISKRADEPEDNDLETRKDSEIAIEEDPPTGEVAGDTEELAENRDSSEPETSAGDDKTEEAPGPKPVPIVKDDRADDEDEVGVAAIPSKRPARTEPAEKPERTVTKKTKKPKTRSASRTDEPPKPARKNQPSSRSNEIEPEQTDEGPVVFRPPQRILIPVVPDEVSEGGNVPQALRDGAQIDELIDQLYGRIRGENKSFISALVLIRKGDNLWDLSKATLGQGYRYPVIYKANRDQIHNPDLIFPGQLLRIPGIVPAG